MAVGTGLRGHGTADRVAIIDRGSIIAAGTPAELKSQYTFDQLLITPRDAVALERQLAALALPLQKTADTYTVRIDDVGQSIELLHTSRDNIRMYEVIKGSMDDVFLSAVGEIPGDSEVAR